METKERVCVHKFGGSSLATTSKIKNAVNVLACKNEVMVVSAFGKTTRQLQKALDNASKAESYIEILNEIEQNHNDIIDQLGLHELGHTLKQEMAQDFHMVKRILDTVTLIKRYPRDIQNIITGFGEIFAAQIIALYIQSLGFCSRYLKASEVLYLETEETPVTIDWETSQQKLNAFLEGLAFDVIVVTGFIASDEQGNRTTLGLNGSDFSAAIFSTLFNARELTIWTDVAGVYSVNPKIVPEARPIPALSYKEAIELAYFGATIIHPQTLSPMMAKQIPVWIKGSLEPDKQGTCITSGPITGKRIVKALTSIDKVVLISLQGAGAIGVSGISARIFDALHRYDIHVLMISQASSEYSICFAVGESQAKLAEKIVRRTFAYDIESGNIEDVHVDNRCAIVTAVGDGMIGSPGAANKIFRTLAKVGTNIHAIAQGSPERSITAVIKRDDEHNALAAMHDAFYGAHTTISLGIVGIGNIAQHLIEQLQKTSSKFESNNGIKIKLLGIMNSRKMLLTNDNLLDESWQALLEQSQTCDFEQFAHHICGSGTESVIVDATASPDVAKSYLSALRKSIHVVTPNKYANTLNINYYHDLHSVAFQKHVKFLYETNVCAGLPVIHLKDMVSTGDKIIQVEGVVSGTLSYIFSQLSLGRRFSEIVLEAYHNGYTEPDPREDLSGMDVARKTVILAREVGFEVELSDLSVENLTPEPLRDVDLETFFTQLSAYDERMEAMIAHKKQGMAGLHYMGEITQKGQISARSKPYHKHSPFSSLTGTDNMVLITSARYHANPFVIRGPGAGPEVTAAGVFADILKTVR
jgi:aspartokinase/homoserine dehydrogenase 1